MDVRSLALLPVRVTVAATQTTLALGYLVSPQGPLLRENGYAARLSQIIGEGGLLDQLATLLDDAHGIVELSNMVAELTAEDRPLGKAIARDGLLDRMASEEGPFVRLLEADGPLDRALAEDGPLYRFLAPGGALDRLLAADGPLDRILDDEGALDRILAPGGLLEQLLADEGILETLLQPGGTLDRLVELGETFEALVPRLDLLSGAIPTLNSAVAVLNNAVEPLSALAVRIPGSRRRPVAIPARDDPDPDTP